MADTKLIILATHGMVKRIEILFGIGELVAMGVQIEYWNLSDVTYNESIVGYPIDGVTNIDIKTRQDFTSRVKNNVGSPCKYVVYMNYTQATCFVYRILSKYNAKMIYCADGVLPAPAKTSVSHLASINIRKRARLAFFHLIKHSNLFKPLEYQLNTCDRSRVDYKVDTKTKFVPFRTTDYILSQKTEVKLVDFPYIVFIDQYLPYHPDMMLHGKNVNAQIYFKGLRSFFDKIEQDSGKKIIIAAHPKALNYQKSNPFGERMIFYGKTNSLIKFCDGVINHYSTAISFGVIFNKPMVIAVSDDIITKLPSCYEQCRTFASVLGLNLYNVDHLPANPIRFEYHKDDYSKYFYDYLYASGLDERSNSELLYQILNS